MSSASTQWAETAVVFEAAPGLPLELPLTRTAASAHGRVGAFRQQARVREPARVQHHLLDGDDVFAVRRRTRGCSRRHAAARRAARRRSGSTRPTRRSASSPRRSRTGPDRSRRRTSRTRRSRRRGATASWQAGTHPVVDLRLAPTRTARRSCSCQPTDLGERAQLARHVGSHRRVEDLGHAARLEQRQPFAQLVARRGPRERRSKSPSSSGRSRSVTATRWSSCTARCRTASGTARCAPATRRRRAARRRRRGRLRTCRGTRRSAPGRRRRARRRPASSSSSSTVPNASAAHHSNSGRPPPIVITPSPSSSATARPFGPFAATTIGVSIGRAGAKPSACSICTIAPSTSTGFAAQQRAQLHDVLLHAGPRQRALAHRHPTGEAGADRDRHPAGRQLLERGDRTRLHERVAQVGDEHGGAESDALGARRRRARASPTRRRTTRVSRRTTPAGNRAARRARRARRRGRGRERTGDLHRRDPQARRRRSEDRVLSLKYWSQRGAI